MNPDQARKYLSDFHNEVREAAFRYALENYVGGKKKIISEDRVTGYFCSVLGVRMAVVWGVTRGTANNRLRLLADHGVIRQPRYGFSHADSYKASDDVCIKFVREAIKHWLAVGYSQTETRNEITEGGSV